MARVLLRAHAFVLLYRRGQPLRFYLFHVKHGLCLWFRFHLPDWMELFELET